jgi:hypothetical protein
MRLARLKDAGRLCALVAAAVLACGTAAGTERDVAPDPAAVPIAAVPIAVAAVNDEDVATALRYQFGQRIDYDNVTSLAGDVTCDGVGDVVVTYWNPDSPEAPALHVMVVTYAVPSIAGVGAASIVVDLPFSNDMQFALCGRPRRTAVALEEWSAADINEVFALPVCRTAIRVEDPDCDPPRLFWITDESQNGRIAFYRN